MAAGGSHSGVAFRLIFLLLACQAALYIFYMRAPTESTGDEGCVAADTLSASNSGCKVLSLHARLLLVGNCLQRSVPSSRNDLSHTCAS